MTPFVYANDSIMKTDDGWTRHIRTTVILMRKSGAYQYDLSEAIMCETATLGLRNHVVCSFLSTVGGANRKTIDRKEAIVIRKARQLYLCSAFHTLN